MAIRVVEEQGLSPPEYAAIPISFWVSQRFVPEPLAGGAPGLHLELESVDPPYVKDYDLDPEEGPGSWGSTWDISNWGIFTAFDEDTRVGAAAVAWNTPGLQMLGGRKDVAALWDLRILPDCRRRGIGSVIFAHTVEWARSKGCSQLVVETQNVNVPACRFYARNGCVLTVIDPLAYPKHPAEVRLVWTLRV